MSNSLEHTSNLIAFKAVRDAGATTVDIILCVYIGYRVITFQELHRCKLHHKLNNSINRGIIYRSNAKLRHYRLTAKGIEYYRMYLDEYNKALQMFNSYSVDEVLKEL
jgi:hypothetical protein